MEVDFTAEQAKIISRLMRLQAAQAKRQMAEIRAQAKAAGSLGRKVSAGAVELDEAEIQALQTVLSSLEVITRMAPELLERDAAAQLESLRPGITKAKCR